VSVQQFITLVYVTTVGGIIGLAPKRIRFGVVSSMNK